MKPTLFINQTTLLLLILVGAIISCNRDNNNAGLYTLQKDGKDLLHLDFRNVTDTVTLKFSEIVEDVSFIQLETNEESMLKIGGLMPGLMNKESLWVGEKYIIAVDLTRGMFQFSIDGKFIRKLVSPGRGPCEFGYPIFTLDETGEGRILIADPTHPKSILQINLTTGECLPNIPRPLSGFIDNILVIDSTIICAPQIGPPDAGEYYLFTQNFDGNLISGIKHQTKQIRSNSKVDALYRIQDKIYFRPDLYDTLFRYDQNGIKPILVIRTRNTKDDELNERYERNIRVSISTDTDFHIIFSADEITKVGSSGGNSSITLAGLKPVLLDKAANRAFKINKFENDLFPIGISQRGPFYGSIYPRVLRANSQNNFFYVYNGHEFKMLSNTISNDPDLDIPPDIREQIIKINHTLKMDGNPVIMIAKAKRYNPMK